MPDKRESLQRKVDSKKTIVLNIIEKKLPQSRNKGYYIYRSRKFRSALRYFRFLKGVLKALKRGNEFFLKFYDGRFELVVLFDRGKARFFLDSDDISLLKRIDRNLKFKLD